MLNSVTIMGRLAKDPELRKTTNGTSVSSFRLAVSRDYQKEETDWIDVIAWKQTAEFVSRYFSKGRIAIVQGRLQSRSWTDKNGNRRDVVEVVADHVYFGDSQKEDKKDPGKQIKQEFEDLSGDDGDLPF